MSPENAQEEVSAEAELAPQPAFDQSGAAGPVARARDGVVAFKFGGSSLSNAKCMLHAAGLVRPVAETSRVVVIVSAIKGVTDRLLACAEALADRKHQRAHAEAENILRLHHDVRSGLPRPRSSP